MVTWRQIVWRARELESAAEAGEVPPAAGAAFVRLVLLFQHQLVDTDDGARPRSDGAAPCRVPVTRESALLGRDEELTLKALAHRNS
jgi:hypothetical protein